MSQFQRIVQLSDAHLFADPAKKLLGITTYDSFNQVLNQAMADNSDKLDLLLLTGDLAQDESLEAYQALSHSLKPYSVKTAWLPGNHDNDTLMKQYITGPQITHDKVISLGPWTVVLMNSHWTNHVEGYFDNNQLVFLEKTLQQLQDQFVLVALHHHILHVGSAWIDKIKLFNSSDFFDIVSAYENVKAIISGHVHQESLQTRKSRLFMTTPSTCFQFKPNTSSFTLDTRPPGYRCIDLYNDGRCDTDVIRVPIDEVADSSQTSY